MSCFQSGHFHHFERLGVGDTHNLRYDGLDLVHNTLFYYNMLMENTLGETWHLLNYFTKYIKNKTTVVKHIYNMKYFMISLRKDIPTSWLASLLWWILPHHSRALLWMNTWMYWCTWNVTSTCQKGFYSDAKSKRRSKTTGGLSVLLFSRLSKYWCFQCILYCVGVQEKGWFGTGAHARSLRSHAISGISLMVKSLPQFSMASKCCKISGTLEWTPQWVVRNESTPSRMRKAGKWIRCIKLHLILNLQI